VACFRMSKKTCGHLQAIIAFLNLELEFLTLQYIWTTTQLCLQIIMAYNPTPCDTKCRLEHQILFLLSGEETNEIINLKYLVFQDH